METALTQLGIGGGTLLVLWLFAQMWMKQAEVERKRNEERLDKRDESLRLLEADIRNKFAGQLMENTNAMLEHSKIMQEVVKLLSKLSQ